MSIPSTLSPVGNQNDIPIILPAGYERVESVFKPAGTYWDLDIPIVTGYKMKITLAFNGISTNYNGGAGVVSSNRHLPGNCLYYFYFASINTGYTGWRIIRNSGSAPGGCEVRTLNTLGLNGEKTTLYCEHKDTSMTFIINGQDTYHVDGLEPFGYPDEKYILGEHQWGYGGNPNIDWGTNMRIWNFEARTVKDNKLVAHFIPFKKKVDDTIVYGLFDIVSHKEVNVHGKVSA